MDQPTPLHQRRHPEHLRHRDHWRWLLDSLEGGQVYRDAIYGRDAEGFPLRNLVRHKHEYPSPHDTRNSSGDMAGGLAAEAAVALSLFEGGASRAEREAIYSPFEFRRSRTPVPEFVREAVEGHLAEIYSHEVARKGPRPIRDWWKDVDGKGTSIDDFMESTVAPLLLTLGQIDLLLDAPAPPEGEVVATRADEERLGLNACRVSVILPENLLWWRHDATRSRYTEVLVREYVEDIEGRLVERLRHWTDSGWTLLEPKEGTVLASGSHPYGRVPIVRVFDKERPRCRNVGMSRYEAIAQLQREYYNRESELVLSDSTYAHPTIQGPEDVADDRGDIPVGPGFMLLKKKTDNGTGTPTYEGYEYIEPPKAGADSIRLNKADLRDQVDRNARLTRPAGAVGSAKSTVEQSGISKSIDQKPINRLLKQISSTLRRCEEQMARLAAVVLKVPDAASPKLQVTYPSNFELYSVSDVSIATSDFLVLLSKTGRCPEAEAPMLQRQFRLVMPDRTDEFYEGIDRAIEAAVAEAKKQLDEQLDLAKQAARAKADNPQADPAGNVRSGVKDTTSRQQPPGQTGKKSAQDAAPKD